MPSDQQPQMSIAGRIANAPGTLIQIAFLSNILTCHFLEANMALPAGLGIACATFVIWGLCRFASQSGLGKARPEIGTERSDVERGLQKIFTCQAILVGLSFGLLSPIVAGLLSFASTTLILLADGTPAGRRRVKKYFYAVVLLMVGANWGRIIFLDDKSPITQGLLLAVVVLFLISVRMRRRRAALDEGSV